MSLIKESTIAIEKTTNSRIAEVDFDNLLFGTVFWRNDDKTVESTQIWHNYFFNFNNVGGFRPPKRKPKP